MTRTNRSGRRERLSTVTQATTTTSTHLPPTLLITTTLQPSSYASRTIQRPASLNPHSALTSPREYAAPLSPYQTHQSALHQPAQALKWTLSAPNHAARQHARQCGLVCSALAERETIKLQNYPIEDDKLRAFDATDHNRFPPCLSSSVS